MRKLMLAVIAAAPAMTLAALEATGRKDHVRVDVTGELKGSVLHVSTLTIPN